MHKCNFIDLADNAYVSKTLLLITQTSIGVHRVLLGKPTVIAAPLATLQTLIAPLGWY